MKLLHHTGLHNGVDESDFFGQLLRGERILDGDVLLEVVEQSLSGGERGLGKVRDRVADNQSTFEAVYLLRQFFPTIEYCRIDFTVRVRYQPSCRLLSGPGGPM